MKIKVFEVEEWECKAFQELEKGHSVEYFDRPFTPENVEEHTDAQIISPFIYSKLDKDVLARCKNLTMIATRSTGFDHIDSLYCRERNITLCNVPTYGEATVAEHVFALLLNISHNIYSSVDRTKKGDFSLQGLRGFDLRAKTIGVVGTGHIGRIVIEIARGFKMNVLGFDARPREEWQEKLGFQYVSLNELLENSDIVTLHVPENPQTRHMIGKKEFGRMKQGAVLINTARGQVIDIEALIEVLATGRLRAAGLDVLPEEPAIREEAELLRRVYQKKHNLDTLLADHVLLRLKNVFITPHNAFNTREAVERILQTTAHNIKCFLEGKAENTV